MSFLGAQIAKASCLGGRNACQPDVAEGDWCYH